MIYGLGIGHGEKGSVHSGIFDSQVKDIVDMRTLRALADATGGNAYYLENAHESGRDRVDEASAEVAAELKQQYTLGYYPTNDKKDGGFRQIVVELKDKSLKVRTKRGYYAQIKYDPKMVVGDPTVGGVMDKKREIRYTVSIGRIFIALAFLAFLGAWFTQSSHITFLGLDWPQLLFDAIVLSVGGTGMFLDALWDMSNIYD